jgi:hypothetical protein
MQLEPLTKSLFDAVVASSGLASLFAPEVIRRACNRAGVNALSLTCDDLIRALPAIRQALAVYMPAADVQRRMRTIEKLAHGKA